jgi:peptidoglycan/xylan/chitin deacetylase (PgdA/CDA1 family)
MGPPAAPLLVTLSFDVDAEAGWLSLSPDYARRLSTLSAARYGVVRGLPRLLELLELHRIRGTFYVPGDTAARHPQAIAAVAAAGHEIGHHGHLHRRVADGISAAQEQEEILRGLEALEACTGARPSGYRSPAWELTPTTFALLVEHGFAYDSSCMGDDDPYYEECGGQRLLELPVHWTLDDWPHIGWTPQYNAQMGDPEAMVARWQREVDEALRERRRHLTFTLHPEVIGRPAPFAALRGYVERLVANPAVALATHAEVAACVREIVESTV